MRSRSQSPWVASTTWRAPAEVISAATSRRSCGGRGREVRAQAGRSSVSTLSCRPVSGIDEPQLAELRELLLAGVADLDRHHVMAAAEHEQRPAPVARAAEVGDHDDVRALPRQRADAPERLADRGRRPPLAPLAAASSSRKASSRPSSPARPCRAGRTRGSPSPNVTRPSRLPRRVAA